MADERTTSTSKTTAPLTEGPLSGVEPLSPQFEAAAQGQGQPAGQEQNQAASGAEALKHNLPPPKGMSGPGMGSGGTFNMEAWAAERNKEYENLENSSENMIDYDHDPENSSER
jgi:hypothetical protein